MNPGLLSQLNFMFYLPLRLEGEFCRWKKVLINDLGLEIIYVCHVSEIPPFTFLVHSVTHAFKSSEPVNLIHGRLAKNSMTRPL